MLKNMLWRSNAISKDRVYVLGALLADGRAPDSEEVQAVMRGRMPVVQRDPSDGSLYFIHQEGTVNETVWTVPEYLWATTGDAGVGFNTAPLRPQSRQPHQRAPGTRGIAHVGPTSG